MPAGQVGARATGGRTLPTESLIERWSPEDAEGLVIEPDRMQYEILAEFSAAMERAIVMPRRMQSASWRLHR